MVPVPGLWGRVCPKERMGWRVRRMTREQTTGTLFDAEGGKETL